MIPGSPAIAMTPQGRQTSRAYILRVTGSKGGGASPYSGALKTGNRHFVLRRIAPILLALYPENKPCSPLEAARQSHAISGTNASERVRARALETPTCPGFWWARQ